MENRLHAMQRILTQTHAIITRYTKSRRNLLLDQKVNDTNMYKSCILFRPLHLMESLNRLQYTVAPTITKLLHLRTSFLKLVNVKIAGS